MTASSFRPGPDGLPFIVKDPIAVLDYTVDWGAWLGASETITSITVTAQTGLTVQSSAIAGNTVYIWLSGGAAGKTYKVTCVIHTSQSRTDQRSFNIVCQGR